MGSDASAMCVLRAIGDTPDAIHDTPDAIYNAGAPNAISEVPGAIRCLLDAIYCVLPEAIDDRRGFGMRSLCLCIHPKLPS